MKYYGWGPKGSPLTVHFTVVNKPQEFDEHPLGRGDESEDNAVLIYKEDQQQITAYPNPVSDEVNIHFNAVESGTFTLKIINTNGQIFHNRQGSTEATQQYSISTNQLGISSGIYYIQLIDSRGKLWTKKILKR